MDNTLLCSRIDYAAMKRDVYAYLSGGGWVPADLRLDGYTTSMLIDEAVRNGMPERSYREAIAMAAGHELAGMEGAGLEPGAAELLESLRGKYVLAVVTNNSEPAAVRALEWTGIRSCFDLVVGRERMKEMKPSASGFLTAMSFFPGIRPEEWVALGDSWIDGKAALDAGVPFVSYRASAEEMIGRGVRPVASVDSLAQFGEWLEGEGS
ncbi:HAD family hydrolase [Paenibacillus thermoaerophilus]|nr:HAD family hydrolase [Paenibacillus thermoaerophilus]